ncbi:hypothetical protein HGRIS_014570 [Hohenbuehelia grisea]|uniref:Uncharacterized protein n=1 Tax=Hohenbuehelia grisea TaxID=104357 RepID=A0ABR3JW30_9AGAR
MVNGAAARATRCFRLHQFYTSSQAIIAVQEGDWYKDHNDYTQELENDNMVLLGTHGE